MGSTLSHLLLCTDRDSVASPPLRPPLQRTPEQAGPSPGPRVHAQWSNTDTDWSLRKKEKDEANRMLRRAVGIAERWFGSNPSHEKLALWRVKLAASLSHQVSESGRSAGGDGEHLHKTAHLKHFEV